MNEVEPKRLEDEELDVLHDMLESHEMSVIIETDDPCVMILSWENRVSLIRVIYRLCQEIKDGQ